MSSRLVHGRPTVLLLGPHLGAISGVSAHVGSLLRSQLGESFLLDHFVIGSEGRRESTLGRAWRLFTSVFQFAGTLRRVRPAIVHLNTSLNAGAFWRDLVYLLLARGTGSRVLYQVHGGKLPREFLGRTPMMQSLLRRILSLPDVIVVLAEQELRAYREFVPGQQVLLIANAVDCQPYRALRRAHAGREGPLRLVYLGRLAREKGLYELLEAVAAACDAGVALHLTLVGSGPEEQGLRQATALHLLNREVTFAGAAFGVDKAQRLASSDVFVLPSYGEGLPYALLEGMAAGNAVIATAVGAIPDIVVPGVHGRLVEPRDPSAIASAICGMAGDCEAMARMQAASAQLIASRYSPERFLARFQDLYESLVAGIPATARSDGATSHPNLPRAAKCAE
jgi:glycosyltransferase involved in cell wall biosynthesis